MRVLTAEEVDNIICEVFRYLTQGNYEFTLSIGGVCVRCTEEGGEK